MARGHDPGAPRVGAPETPSSAPSTATVPTPTRKSARTHGRERLDEDRGDLGIGRGPRRPDELDARLRELPRLAAQGRVLAEHLGDVREAVRA